jgi:hypothetical protein
MAELEHVNEIKWKTRNITQNSSKIQQANCRNFIWIPNIETQE